MTLNSIYSLVVEVPAGSFPGAAHVFEDDAILAFAANQGAKLGWASEGDETEVWTVLSTGASLRRADISLDESRRRRGRDVDLPWSRGGAAAATWIFRGVESRRRRGRDADVRSRPARASGTAN